MRRTQPEVGSQSTNRVQLSGPSECIIAKFQSMPQVIFFGYSRYHSKQRKGDGPRYGLVDHAAGLANAGFLAGGIAGYLLRPVAPTGAKLGMQDVIDRGITLTDPVLKAVAQSSFNTMVFYAFIGTIAGAAVGFAIHRMTTPPAPAQSGR